MPFLRGRSRTALAAVALLLPVAGVAVAQQKVPYFRSGSASGTPQHSPLTVPNYGGVVSARVGETVSIPAATPVGGHPPYVMTLTGDLRGLTHVGAGAVSGTPTSSGTSDLTLTATDSRGATATASLRLVVSPAQSQPIALSLSPLPPTEVIVGQSYSGTLAVSGGKAPYEFLPTAALPGTLRIDGDTLWGSFNTPGTFSYGVSATDAQAAQATDEVHFSTVVYQGFSATLSAHPQPSANVGESISEVRIEPKGGKLPYVFGHVGTLPIGLDYQNGVLKGVPGQPGSYTFSLTAAQALPGVPVSQSQSYTMVVSPAPLQVAGTSLPVEYVIGEPLATRPSISATGGTAPYVYEVDPALPPGMSFLASAGTSSGTPNAPGIYSFVLTARDSSATPRSGQISQSVTVYPALTISGNKPAYLNSGTPVSGFSYTATGGKGNHTFTMASGSLPPPLLLQTDGTVVGTPTGSGQANYTIRVIDALGTQKTIIQSLFFAPPLQVLTTIPDAEQNQPYDRLVVTGGRSVTATMTSGTLPNGVDFSNGRVYGHPTNSGTFTFVVSATDADGRSDSSTVTLVVTSSSKAASRSLLNSANFAQSVGAASNMYLRWAPPYTSMGQHENPPASNAAKVLEFAKDPVEYDKGAAGTVLMAANSTSGGGVKFTMTYGFSEDVVASSLDQKIGFGEGANCVNQSVGVVYEASLNGSSWSPLISIPVIKGTATSLGVGYGGTYYNMNQSFAPTTLRFVRATYTGTGCSSGTSAIYLRSGIVK